MYLVHFITKLVSIFLAIIRYDTKIFDNDTLQITPNVSMIRCKSNKTINEFELEMYNQNVALKSRN